jgi:hypothetical protein
MYNLISLQAVTAIVDTWVSGRPHRLQHVWCPLLFGLVYMIFNVVYVVAFDGTDPNGRDYIYPVLKWNESPGEDLCSINIIITHAD